MVYYLQLQPCIFNYIFIYYHILYVKFKSQQNNAGYLSKNILSPNLLSVQLLTKMALRLTVNKSGTIFRCFLNL